MASSNKPAAKSSLHSRFIPREEIDAVASWQFSAIGGVTEPAPLLEVPAPPPPAPVIDESDVREAREQSFAAGYADGYAEGYAKGHESGSHEVRDALQDATRKQADDLAEHIASVVKSMTDDLLDREQDMARQTLLLACEIARQVVRHEIRTNPQLLRPVIGEALEMIIDDGLPASVHMNPDDLARMHDALSQTLGENAPDFVGDSQVAPGGCVVHTPSCTVDASIERRWIRAVGNLGVNLEWTAEDPHENG